MKLNDNIKNNKKKLIIALVAFLIAVILFVLSDFFIKDEKVQEPTDYNSLIAVGKDVENLYVKVTIADIPYLVATEENGNYKRSYYIVFDENDYMYITRLTDETYDMLKEEYEKDEDNFKYELKGYIFNIEDELKQIAMEAYNEGREEAVVTEENFALYFGNTYLDEINTPVDSKSTIIMVIEVIATVLAIVFFISYLIVETNTKKELNKYGKKQIEEEIESPETISFEKAKIYLTKTYMISVYNGLKVIPYTDIVWMYNEKRRQNGITVGIYLIVATKEKKKYPMGYVYSDENNLQEIMMKVQERNPEIMLGFTNENIDKFKQIEK